MLLGALITVIAVLVVIDFRDVTGPDHVNDDGGGWMLVLGSLALMVLIPLWAIVVWIAVACRRRSRAQRESMSG